MSRMTEDPQLAALDDLWAEYVALDQMVKLDEFSHIEGMEDLVRCLIKPVFYAHGLLKHAHAIRRQMPARSKSNVVEGTVAGVLGQLKNFACAMAHCETHPHHALMTWAVVLYESARPESLVGCTLRIREVLADTRHEIETTPRHVPMTKAVEEAPPAPLGERLVAAHALPDPEERRAALEAAWADVDLWSLAREVKWSSTYPAVDWNSLYHYDEKTWTISYKGVTIADQTTIDLIPVARHWSVVPTWDAVWTAANGVGGRSYQDYCHQFTEYVLHTLRERDLNDEENKS